VSGRTDNDGMLPGGSRLAPLDVLDVSLLGLRTRPARAALSALGIAVGIATMILVIGVPAAAQHSLLEQLTSLGTNVLRATPQKDQSEAVVLPENADAMVERIAPVIAASAVANTHTTVRRNDQVDPNTSVGTTVLAARADLLSSITGSLSAGRFLSESKAGLPQVVLGSVAATRLGITDLPPANPAPLVVIGTRWFSVVGILNPMPLDTDLERSVLVDWEAARQQLGFDGHPTVVYARVQEAQLEDVRSVFAPTLYPQLPDYIQVNRLSDALLAKRATQSTFSALFLGLAAVALIVGGIGVANTMVISVLERRREIGLRRALGAHPGQIRIQFLGESIALSMAGGLTGSLLGTLATLGYATYQQWPLVVPWTAVVAGAGGAAVVGAIAGLYPAIRAARLTPTQALATI
jgi:putative ABC transport system permease protein